MKNHGVSSVECRVSSTARSTRHSSLVTRHCQRGQAIVEYLLLAICIAVAVLAVASRVWLKTVAMTSNELGRVDGIP